MSRTSQTPEKRARGGTSTRLAWQDKFVAEFRKKGTIGAAAKACGVARSTVYEEFKRWPDLAAQVQEIREEQIEQVEATLYQCALNPDATTDRIFYLKTQKPQVYGDKLRQDQIDQIKAEARREVLAEVQRELEQLTPEARKLLMSALPVEAGPEGATP